MMRKYPGVYIGVPITFIQAEWLSWFLVHAIKPRQVDRSSIVQG